mmetsp:Transcript_20706/g.42519  ORF Transcript_20706/g.42519 Transcript_20706/m.42519 type:complete len:385 (+) Transcript_20706:486-1640(+)
MPLRLRRRAVERVALPPRTVAATPRARGLRRSPRAMPGSGTRRTETPAAVPRPIRKSAGPTASTAMARPTAARPTPTTPIPTPPTTTPEEDAAATAEPAPPPATPEWEDASEAPARPCRTAAPSTAGAGWTIGEEVPPVRAGGTSAIEEGGGRGIVATAALPAIEAADITADRTTDIGTSGIGACAREEGGDGAGIAIPAARLPPADLENEEDRARAPEAVPPSRTSEDGAAVGATPPPLAPAAVTRRRRRDLARRGRGAIPLGRGVGAIRLRRRGRGRGPILVRCRGRGLLLRGRGRRRRIERRKGGEVPVPASRRRDVADRAEVPVAAPAPEAAQHPIPNRVANASVVAGLALLPRRRRNPNAKNPNRAATTANETNPNPPP